MSKFKFYCVYFPYPKWEMMDKSDENYNSLPNYPRDFARVGVYTDNYSQLQAYANTPCPASLTFEANSQEEIDKKVEELKNNFENEEWLKKNIYPYC